MTTFPIKRLGFFTRLLDQTTAAERYRLATEQIVHAEKNGFDSAWIAQHHFHEGEGGLPSPFVFLAHAAARTSRIRLGTGIVTLPLELPIRVAEDAVVTDVMGAPLSLTSDKSTECYRNWWPGPGDAMVRLMNRSIDLCWC